ncbi:MAG: S8 family serine peptidase [Acidimicrobiia bacterium]|nr:S8 family serine peptidase [Acidimicrobiia bacterium]
MAEHLELPEPVALPDRRSGNAFGSTERRDPVSHGGALRDGLDQALAAPVRRVVDGVDPRRVFKIRSSTRLADAELRARDLQLLGDTDGWTYFVVPDEASATELYRAIGAYADDGVGDASAPLASFFERIDRIEPYGPDDRTTASLDAARTSRPWPLLVDIVVWPSPDQAEATRRVSDVQRALEQYGAALQGSDTRPQSTVVRTSCGEAALEAVLSLMVVEKVRLPLAPLLEPSSWLMAQAGDLVSHPPIDVSVGVLDDGVAFGHPLLSGVVVASYEFPENHAWEAIGPHGTMVAGLAAYGGFEEALAVGGGELPRPVRLVVARVLEPDGSGNPLSTHLPSGQPDHEVVETAIRYLHIEHGVRIFNLSITDRFPYSGPHASVLTETIDRLARELDLVVVVAAGNRPFTLDGTTSDGAHTLDDYPSYLHDDEARLAEPAAAANVITVGSLGLSDAPVTASGVSYVDRHVVAGRNRPSPFSRTGPGVVAQVKPDMAHYGGDLVWTGTNLNSQDPGASCVSLNIDHQDRLLRVASGTSFAAPRVANLAARVHARYPQASANLVRALLAVATHHPDGALTGMGEADLFRTVGSGVPRHDHAVDSFTNRVVMVSDSEISCDTALIHPVPMPEAFARGRADRSISIAMAYDPPVRRQRREYLGGRIKVDLYRNIELAELQVLMSRQDPDDPQALPRDRRRIQNQLRPTGTLALGSTLQVRRWTPKAAASLNPDDGDTYYLVLTHAREAWAERLPEDYTRQRYALAIELWDRERPEVDLYNLVQNQVRVPARVRFRA